MIPTGEILSTQVSILLSDPASVLDMGLDILHTVITIPIITILSIMIIMVMAMVMDTVTVLSIVHIILHSIVVTTADIMVTDTLPVITCAMETIQ